MTLELGDPAPELELTNQHGEQVPISRYWQEHPAVFFFVRHLG